MNVKTILATKGGDTVSIEPTADLAAAAQLLSAHRIGAVVILSAEGASPASCRSATSSACSANAAPGARRAGQRGDDAQGRQLRRADTVAAIMEMMTPGKFRHLPVGQGELVGLISIGDVVKWRVGEYEMEQEALRDYIRTAYTQRSHVSATVQLRGHRQRGDSARMASVTGLDGVFGRLGAVRDHVVGAVEIEPADLADPRAISTSGGSPASRARVMRSCMMLKASTMTVEMPGRPRRRRTPASWCARRRTFRAARSAGRRRRLRSSRSSGRDWR